MPNTQVDSHSINALYNARNTNAIAEGLGGLPTNMPMTYRGSNDGYDAFRHAYVSAVLTQFLANIRLSR